MCLTGLGKNLNGKKILRSKNAIENAADFIISSYLLLYQNKFFMIDFKSIVLGKNIL